MNITPEEAQMALNDIRRLTDKTQYVSKVWAFYMVLWGLIWTVGFLASQMQPNLIDWIWYTMIGIGMIGSAILGVIQSRQARLAPGSQAAFINSRLGISQGLLYIFGFLWLFLFTLSPLQIGLLWITITMLGYILTGVWLRESLYIGFSVGVIIMAIVGYYLVPHYFWLWVTIFAGLPVAGLGLYCLRKR